MKTRDELVLILRVFVSKGPIIGGDFHLRRCRFCTGMDGFHLDDQVHDIETNLFHDNDCPYIEARNAVAKEPQ